MYKIVCTKGNVELTTTKENGEKIVGQLFDNLSDAWDFLQTFQIGVNLISKYPSKYRVEELREPGHLGPMIEFTLKVRDGRIYTFILSKEDEFDE